MDFLEREISRRDRCELFGSMSTQNPEDREGHHPVRSKRESRPMGSAAALQTGTFVKKCDFCGKALLRVMGIPTEITLLNKLNLSFFWVFLSTWPNHSLFHPSKFRPPPPPTWKAGYGHEKLADSYLYKEGGHVGVSVIWSKVKLHRPIFPRLLQLPPAHLDPPLMHATLFY